MASVDSVVPAAFDADSGMEKKTLLLRISDRAEVESEEEGTNDGTKVVEIMVTEGVMDTTADVSSTDVVDSGKEVVIEVADKAENRDKDGDEEEIDDNKGLAKLVTMRVELATFSTSETKDGDVSIGAVLTGFVKAAMMMSTGRSRSEVEKRVI